MRRYVCNECNPPQVFEDRFRRAIHARWGHQKAPNEPQLASCLRKLLSAIEEYASYNPTRFAVEGIPKNSLLNFLVGRTGKKKKDLLEVELPKLEQAGYTRAGLWSIFIINRAALKLRPAGQPANYDYYIDPDFFMFGVDESATFEKVKKIYRRKIKVLHPDRGGDPEVFMRVHAAYKRLEKKVIHGSRKMDA